MVDLDYLKDIGRARNSVNNIASSPVGEVVAKFANSSIEKMKENMADSDRNATGALSSSLTFNFEAEGDGVNVEFLALEYWDFINSGVNGVQNDFGSPYSFRTLTVSKSMRDAFTGTGSLRGWMAARNITSLQYTNKDGEQITKQLSTEKDFEQAAFVFARAVKEKGIKPNQFLDKVLNEEALDKFEDDIFEAFQSMLQ